MVIHHSTTASSHNRIPRRALLWLLSLAVAFQSASTIGLNLGCGSYLGVGEQSGLFAGEGGYHVEARAVELLGGAIASADAGRSELSAGTLAYGSLANRMSHSASGGHGPGSDGW